MKISECIAWRKGQHYSVKFGCFYWVSGKVAFLLWIAAQNKNWKPLVSRLRPRRGCDSLRVTQWAGGGAAPAASLAMGLHASWALLPGLQGFQKALPAWTHIWAACSPDLLLGSPPGRPVPLLLLVNVPAVGKRPAAGTPSPRRLELALLTPLYSQVSCSEEVLAPFHGS